MLLLDIGLGILLENTIGTSKDLLNETVQIQKRIPPILDVENSSSLGTYLKCRF